LFFYKLPTLLRATFFPERFISQSSVTKEKRRRKRKEKIVKGKVNRKLTY